MESVKESNGGGWGGGDSEASASWEDGGEERLLEPLNSTHVELQSVTKRPFVPRSLTFSGSPSVIVAVCANCYAGVAQQDETGARSCVF